MKMEKIAVLIPCYNEELTIEKVIKDFKKELPEADIYVYNNNSKDRTREIAVKNGAIVVDEYKQGKGNVVRSQFRDIEADIYVMVDGDDTYPAEFVHKLIEPVKNGEADMAIGDRLSNGTYQKENKRPFHELGNNLVKKSINVLFKTDLKDIMTGYRVFNKRFVKNMPVLSPKFEIETEMSLYVHSGEGKFARRIYGERRTAKNEKTLPGWQSLFAYPLMAADRPPIRRRFRSRGSLFCLQSAL